jgi:flagellar basal body-associated protein FliL
MVKRNIVIFIIILVLFIVIAAVGYTIYRMQSTAGFGRGPRSVSTDEEA